MSIHTVWNELFLFPENFMALLSGARSAPYGDLSIRPRLEKNHLNRAISLVVSGNRKLQDLIDWANLLECEDAIDIQNDAKEILHALANAEINELDELNKLKIYYNKIS